MSLSRLRSPSIRSLHALSRSYDRVGPPDPISNIRPVVYDDDPHQTTPPTFHPYSLHEFRDLNGAHDVLLDYQLRWKLHKQHLDAFNHAFWTDSNTRFEAGKTAALLSLSPNATELDKENALTEFYKQWLQQEQPRMDAYTNEWRRRNFHEILLAARVHYHTITSRISSWKSR